MLAERLLLILLPIFIWLIFFPIFIGSKASDSIPPESRSLARRKFWLKILTFSIVIGFSFKFIYSMVFIPDSLPVFETILKSGFFIGGVVGFVYASVSRESNEGNN